MASASVATTINQAQISGVDYDRLIEPGERVEYVYMPIPGDPKRRMIRLLELVPLSVTSETISPIHCRIKDVNLDENLEYVALSYYWGDTTIKYPIYCEGAEIRVTKNLVDALLMLRQHSSGNLLFWIDAVCINQSNVDEKNHQVPLMRDIYSRSTETRVWLGKSDNVFNGMVMVKRFLIIKEAMTNANDDRSVLAMTQKEIEAYNIPAAFDAELFNFYDLFMQPWFSRVWVIQEAAVSPIVSVCCTSNSGVYASVGWESLFGTIETCLKLGIAVSSGETFYNPFSISAARSIFQRKRATTLLPLLMLHQNFHATDARDKVYGLLGLLGEGLDLQPDYGLPVEQVYFDTAVAIIKKDKNLDIFGAARKSRNPSFPIPTWCVDWSYQSGIFGLHLIARNAGFKPSRLKEYELKLDPDGKLIVEGFVFASIKELGYPDHNRKSLQSRDLKVFSEAGQIVREHCNIYSNWKRVAKCRSKATYVTGESMRDAFWQTLAAGNFEAAFDEHWQNTKKIFESYDLKMTRMHRWQWWRLMPLMVPLGVIAFLLSLVCDLLPWKLLDCLKKAGWGLTSVDHDFSYVCMPSHGRRMMRTDTGHIGLAPVHTTALDKVALLNGASVPVILRPHQDSWELVGEAYVHGIMFGEAWDSSKCKEIRIL